MEGPMPPMKGASTHWGHQGPIAGILHLPPICWLGDVLEMTGAQYSGLWDYWGYSGIQARCHFLIREACMFVPDTCD